MCEDYGALPEDERVALLAAEMSQPRLLHSPYAQYSEETRKELAIFRAARDARTEPLGFKLRVTQQQAIDYINERRNKA